MFDKGYFIRTPDMKTSNLIHPSSYVWKWGQDTDKYKGAGMLDHTNPDGKKYWFDNRELPLYKLASNSDRLDLGDPEMYDPNGKFLAPEGQGHNHGDNHNIYNNEWVKMIEEGLDERNNLKERPFTLSRAMTIGKRERTGRGYSQILPTPSTATCARLWTLRWPERITKFHIGGFCIPTRMRISLEQATLDGLRIRLGSILPSDFTIGISMKVKNTHPQK